MNDTQQAIHLKPYRYMQERVRSREPFNEDVINFRMTENVETLFSNVLKGLEVIKGVEFLSCTVDNFKHVYENKKPTNLLTKEEIEKLAAISKLSKGTNKSSKSPYPLTPIRQSRFLSVRFRMRFTDDKETVEQDYEIYYPELVNGQYFYLSGNKFYPVFQLAEAEYYRSGSHSIVLKTTFMPIKMKGSRTDMEATAGDMTYPVRTFELDLFRKTINVFLYYFAKYGVTKTQEFFGLDGIHLYFQGIDKVQKDESLDISNQGLFKITQSLTIGVDKQWIEEDPKVRGNLAHTFIQAFKKKHINESVIDNLEYWMKQLGRQFTNNASKAMEKADSIVSSLERLLDVTTKRSMRNPEEEKIDIYHAIKSMILNFDNIIMIDGYNLDNKRIRVNEYLIYPFVARISKSVYRLVSDKSPSVAKLKSIFSSIDTDFLIKKINTINLVRFSNQVNTIDLFTRILKGSKMGPQSQKGDNNSTNLGIRGIDSSYLGRLDVTSTSSNDPGISFTVVPFCEVHDPTGNNNFYFSDRPDINGFKLEGEDDYASYEDLVEVDDTEEGDED